MGQRESCGLIIFGKREGNFDAYGFTDEEGKYLTHLYKDIKHLKCKNVKIMNIWNRQLRSKLRVTFGYGDSVTGGQRHSQKNHASATGSCVAGPLETLFNEKLKILIEH